MRILEWAGGAIAAYALGNLCYDKRRHHDAIAAWESAAGSDIPQVHRNLAIARWNIHRDADAARAGYLKAIELDPADPRLVSEFDQLRAKLNDPLEDRLAFLREKRELVLQRDDASVALATLLNLTGRPQEALDLLLSRRFHPWEGGEGSVIRQFTTAKILLGRRALEAGDPAGALLHFQGAMETPDSLGEKYHLLQAKADLNYWIGRTFTALGRADEARAAFEASAGEAGDFAEMAVTAHSPLSWFRGLSLRALGRETEAAAFFHDLLAFATSRIGQPAKIDYFATSLPNLLVFEEDLQQRRDSEHRLLAALARHGLGDFDESARMLDQVLAFNRADQRAIDLFHELEGAATPA
jgi:tetratricopeptide (TPR) repeat protein